MRTNEWGQKIVKQTKQLKNNKTHITNRRKQSENMYIKKSLSGHKKKENKRS